MAETISLKRQLACARRELHMRNMVYPNRVLNGRMTQQEADDETAAMAAIVATLEGLLAQDDGQLPLGLGEHV